MGALTLSTSEASLYYIQNLVNKKGYVGQTTYTVGIRFSQHKQNAKRGSTHALHCAMRKYGIDKFIVSKVLSCDQALVNELEANCIELFGTHASKHGYNVAKGGHGSSGWSHSEETKAKISKAKTGRTQSAEHIRKAAEGKRGRRQSEETKAKIKATLRRRFNGDF